MSTHLPEPLPLFWECKSVSSANAGTETLNNGRKKYWIKHDVLKDVTPRMLAWWFGHMEGDVEIPAKQFPRYRVWHPRDRVYARYVRRAPHGSVGPGAQIALCEYLDRNPAYKIETVSTIEKLDETGFIHNVIQGGVRFARMEHVFTKTVDGTRHENCLIVPGTQRLGPFAKLLGPFLLPDGKGRAWLKHNIEEMGSLENFFPSSMGEKPNTNLLIKSRAFDPFDVKRRYNAGKISKLEGRLWLCIGPGTRCVFHDIRPGRENQLFTGHGFCEISHLRMGRRGKGRTRRR